MKQKIILIGMLLINTCNIFSQTIKFDDKGKLIGELPNYIGQIPETLIKANLKVSPSDDCSNATDLSAASNLTVINQSTFNATDSKIIPTGNCIINIGTPDDDVWFKFKATATTMYLSASYVSGNRDVYWQVFSGSCAASMTSIFCTDNDAGGILTGLTNGSVYYIRLYTKAASVETTQNISLSATNPVSVSSFEIQLDSKMSSEAQKKETDKLEKKYSDNATKSNDYYKYDKGFPAVANANYIFDKEVDLNISLHRVLASTALQGATSKVISSGDFNKILYKADNGTEKDITSTTLFIPPFEEIKLKKINVKNVVIKGKYEESMTDRDAVAAVPASIGPPVVAAVAAVTSIIGYKPLDVTISDADIQKVKSEMQVYYDQLKEIYYNHGNTIDDELLNNITTYTDNHSVFIGNLRKYIEKNADWLKNTAFINGVPTLNPLGFTNTDEIEAKIKLKETELKLKETERSTINDLFQKSKKNDWTTFDVVADKYKKLKMETESSILSLTDEISRLRKQLTDNEKIKKTWTNGATILNDVQILPTKKTNEPIYMRHHDASNNMVSMDNNVLPFDIKRYEEHENVKILLHNIEAAKYKGTFDTSIVSITETALLTETVLPVINGIIDNVGNISPAVSTPIVSSIVNASQLSSLPSEIKKSITLDKVPNTPLIKSKISFSQSAVLRSGITPTTQDKNVFNSLNLPSIAANGLMHNSVAINESILTNLNNFTLDDVGSGVNQIPFEFLDLVKVNLEINKSLYETKQRNAYIDLNTFITNYAMVNWLSTQTTPQPYPDLEDAGPVYKTETYEAKPNDRIPSSVTYTVGRLNKTDSTDKSKVSFNYKVYKKQYIQFTAMAAFFPIAKQNLDKISVNQRTVVSYDGNNNTFTTHNYKPYDIVVGAKIYPFGLNIRRWLPVNGTKQSKEYKSILQKRGDLIRNRFSIMVGLSVSQKQLRNYFFGLGYEIVPGLGINGGVNIYSTPHYKIEQNKLVSTKEHFKPAYFLGFSFDPIVLIQAIALGRL